MRPCNPGKAFKTILFVESLLIFSLISGFLVCILISLGDSTGEIQENGPAHRRFWLNNYKILHSFMDPTVAARGETDGKKRDSREWDLKQYRDLMNLNKKGQPGKPLIEEFLKLKTVEANLENNRPRNIGKSVFESPSQYPFIEIEKERLQLMYYHSLNEYSRVVQIYNRHPLKNSKLSILYLHSLIKTGNSRKAQQLFRTLFLKNHLSSFKILSSRDLNRLISKLKNEFWHKKLIYLGKKNAFWEIYREKKYIPSFQMAALYDAEYHFRRHRYQRAKNFLKRVKSEDLQDYKSYLSLMIRLRKATDSEYHILLNDIHQLKDNRQLHADLLLNAANLLLVRGRLGDAHRLYQRFVDISAAPSQSDYWKAIWISAWIQFKQNQKKQALEYFKRGKSSPILPFRIANQFWAYQLKKNFSHELDRYPFSYYYTRLGNHPSLLTRKTLKRFTTLIDRTHSPLFSEVISALKFLINHQMADDARNLIMLTKNYPVLSDSDRNMLKLIESIIYLNQNNYYQAFIQFKKNFPCYECFYLPQFLSEIYLPVEYEHLINKYSRENDLDPYLVLALIREESFFRSDVVSAARACGLMQILYGTAKEISRKSGFQITRKDLFTPAVNIRLGTRYLKSLINKYNGKTHLALAAYNAGDYRVDQWIEKFGNVPEKEFIEMIPFTETRTYVKNIFRNYYYYKFYNLKSGLLAEP